MKTIYLVQLIESESERILFATFDEENAKRYAEKANKMISKWQEYFDYVVFDEGVMYNDHIGKRFNQWFEYKYVRVVKTEIR